MFQNEQALGSCPENRDDTVPCFLHCTRNRIQRCGANATPYTQDCAVALDVCWLPQRSDDIVQAVPRTQHGHFARCLAHGLNDERNGPHFRVGVCNRERDAFPPVRHSNDDKLPRLAMRGNQRRVDNVSRHVWSQLFLGTNDIHACPLVFSESAPRQYSHIVVTTSMRLQLNSICRITYCTGKSHDRNIHRRIRGGTGSAHPTARGHGNGSHHAGDRHWPGSWHLYFRA